MKFCPQWGCNQFFSFLEANWGREEPNLKLCLGSIGEATSQASDNYFRGYALYKGVQVSTAACALRESEVMASLSSSRRPLAICSNRQQSTCRHTRNTQRRRKEGNKEKSRENSKQHPHNCCPSQSKLLLQLRDFYSSPGSVCFPVPAVHFVPEPVARLLPAPAARFLPSLIVRLLSAPAVALMLT
eukprot:6182277-Pleurochrysis_carterae.AAC.2